MDMVITGSTYVTIE